MTDFLVFHEPMIKMKKASVNNETPFNWNQNSRLCLYFIDNTGSIHLLKNEKEINSVQKALFSFMPFNF